MTSKFNTETMTTMRRLMKNQQKTTNMSTSKKTGGRTNPEEQRAVNAKRIFQNRLPSPLKPKDAAHPEGAKDDQKQATKVELKENSSANLTVKNDLGISEMDQNEEDHKKKEELKKQQLEKDLEQVIYITITETPTSILFYSPSTKYLTLKNGKMFI